MLNLAAAAITPHLRLPELSAVPRGSVPPCAACALLQILLRFVSLLQNSNSCWHCFRGEGHKRPDIRPPFSCRRKVPEG